ncbi:MAG: SAM-dependent methyltransferase [Gaiellales bacterium]
MNCCTQAGYRDIFGAQQVERDVRRYRRKGLTGSARWLRDTIVSGGVADRSVLEIGGGIGAMQIELLQAGASRAVNVELVDSYEAAAAGLASEHGVGNRIGRELGDLAGDPGLAPAADIVVMHRVICCYPDAGALMQAACDHATHTVAITVPRDSWWVRLGFAAMNAWLRVRRVAFRGFVHPVEPMLAGAQGFGATDRTSGPLWTSIVLHRRDPA